MFIPELFVEWNSLIGAEEEEIEQSSLKDEAAHEQVLRTAVFGKFGIILYSCDMLLICVSLCLIH